MVCGERRKGEMTSIVRSFEVTTLLGAVLSTVRRAVNSRETKLAVLREVHGRLHSDSYQHRIEFVVRL